MNQSLVFNDSEVCKKDFYASKQAIPLNLDFNDTSKYSIGYNYEDKIRPLYIILPQITGYIKYFENGSNVI